MLRLTVNHDAGELTRPITTEEAAISDDEFAVATLYPRQSTVIGVSK